MIVRQFDPQDWVNIELQPAQEYLRQYIDIGYFSQLTANAVTAIEDNRIIAMAGVKEEGEYGHLWCFLSIHAPRHMVTVHRMAARLIETFSQRLVATVEEGFDDGDRWLELLGFEFAAIADNYGPDQRNHKVYFH